MWFYDSPHVIFGEGALSFLNGLSGKRVFIVTDAVLHGLGLTGKVCAELEPTGMVVEVYTDVEPDPAFDSVERGAQAMQEFGPDWIIALGGGSVMDAAKAMWILYENPGISPEAINPIETIVLRQKARLIAIPTTSGTGSEATWAIVLTDPLEKRKLGLGNRANLPDYAVLDPELVAQLPPRLTADTGLDALTHAIEGYTTTFHNDFSDGPCIQAARLIFDFLARVYQDGSDLEARGKVQNAAAIAGQGFGNSMAGLAHGMGHALGGVFHIPHGRAVALFLPYTIEYCALDQSMPSRYGELARVLGLPAADETEGAAALVGAIRKLQGEVGQPLTLRDCGITRDALERELDLLVSHALNDSQTVMATRVPETADLRRLFMAAYDGATVGF